MSLWEEAPDWRSIGSTLRTARKQRTCNGCGQPIEPGTRYRRDTQIVDGEWSVFHCHANGCPVRWEDDAPPYEDPFQDE